MEDVLLNKILEELQKVNNRLSNLEKGQEKIFEKLEVNRIGKKLELDDISERLNTLDGKINVMEKIVNSIKNSAINIEDKIDDLQDGENTSEDII